MDPIPHGIAHLALIILLVAAGSMASAQSTSTTLHEFTMPSIEGDPVDLADYEGRLVLIVNTASKCGFTPQYEGLVDLYHRYRNRGFVVLGFPANNFGGQEPGTDAEIQQFCTSRFAVDFPMFSKVSVKGDDQHGLFGWLTTAPNPDFTGPIKWNFEKFLVGPDGQLLRRFRSRTKPLAPELVKAIEANLP